jgi:fructose PTS system EIIBC or EIIC component
MSIFDRLTPELIKVPLSSQTKEEAITELVETCRLTGRLNDFDAALKDVLQREALASTGLENAIAIPHAKTASVSSLVISVGISPRGIDFQSVDGRPTRLLFLIMAPPDISLHFVYALKEIVDLAKFGTLLDNLLGARSGKEFLTMLDSV